MIDDPFQSLLTHTAWVRALAARLVADPATADDVAQEVWLDALRRPPRHAGNLRGFLARLTRSHAARAGRARTRRDRHEAVAARDARIDDDAARLVARVTRQREIAGLVLALDEPYRTAILLRYFEELPPQVVAARTGVPLETVRTRLRRALARLRARIEAEHGAGWRAGLVAAFGPFRSPAPPAGATTTGLGEALAMNHTRSILTVTLVALTALTGLLLRGALAGPGPDATDAGAASGTAPVPRTWSRRASDAAAEPTASSRRAVTSPGHAAAADRDAQGSADTADDADAPGAARVVTGRVVDADGEPRIGVAVHWAGPHAVRWADSHDPWLNNGTDSVHLTPELRERLRTDPTFAEAALAGLDHADEWRAALLGAVRDGRGTRTGADGRFALELEPEHPTPGRVTVVEPGLRAIASGRDPDGGLVLVACPVVDVAGTVRDAAGRPVAGASVTNAGARARLRLPYALADERAFPPRVDSTLDSGRYLLREVPVLAGATLEARRADLGVGSVPVPSVPTDACDLVLGGVSPDATRAAVRGRVVDARGDGIAGAHVLFGAIRTATDAAGGFAFETAVDGPDRALIAVAPPYRAAVLDGFSERLPALAAVPEEVVVRLSEVALAIEGRVLDASGAPLAGASLNLFDPTLPETTFSSLEMLADARRDVTIASDGRFRIGGLAPRGYRLRIWSVERMLVHVSAPIAAGARDVTVRLPDLPPVERARGRVVDHDGAPVARAEVRVGLTTFQPRHGWLGLHGPAVTTDENGDFELGPLPRRHVFVEVSGPPVVARRFDVEAVDVEAPRLVVDRACPVRVVDDGALGVDALRFTAADGAALAVTADGEVVDRVVRHPSLGWPELVVPDRARAVRALRGTLEVLGRRFEPQPGRRIDLPLR